MYEDAYHGRALSDIPSLETPRAAEKAETASARRKRAAGDRKSALAEERRRAKEEKAAARAQAKAHKEAAAAAAAAGSLANGEKDTPTGRTKRSRQKRKREDEDDGAEFDFDGEDAANGGAGDTPMRTPKIKLTAKKPPSQKEIKALAKQFTTVYDGIWKDIAKKDASKVFKVIQASQNVRQTNARKTSALAAREARRWQIRTNKNTKDLQARAKRAMREMLGFWKKNEREERDLRKKAEKEALDLAKREEEQREARRQARKLNFLITQTELYSHFVGKKIKTDEAEANGVAAPAQQSQSEDVVMNGTEEAAQPQVRDITELDFDGDDDEALRQAAMANAQSAVAEAQQRAMAFNEGATTNATPKPGTSSELKKVDIDSEEMNFQNPTSLGDIQISQPKMLSCKLMEYQLKGLNWLANLYEQGINGILADDMGLGKTVQSISVMAYLAETHNIWGPYLVIAPASTLHNWQQEITKFVPGFKVLPYWGNAKDRKILRKFWDRKQLTYTKDSPFHVLVTSYQLVVADAQYFQRVKWQYMILDEAQAIKSSQSARWKSLLSFQCRNRLLLTGTPIQNSMQELWALLHFIMPSLFDSHEEFSEWFSKDIESHAANNSQLNEQQLKRLHMILKPFMLRRTKKNVQQELGEKIEIDVYCNLTRRQRVLYQMLRSQINMADLIERATSDEGAQSLMNLVMQFRKVCNHPDLFERGDVKSAYSFASFAETPALNRDGPVLDVAYTSKNPIELRVPKLMYRDGGFLDVPSENSDAGHRARLSRVLSVWDPEHMRRELHRTSGGASAAYGWLSLSSYSASEVSRIVRNGLFERAASLYSVTGEPQHEQSFLLLSEDETTLDKQNLGRMPSSSPLYRLTHVRQAFAEDHYYDVHQKAAFECALAPPISLVVSDMAATQSQRDALFDSSLRSMLFPMSLDKEWSLVQGGCPASQFPPSDLLPAKDSRAGYTSIQMPSMMRFITESGKLSRLDELLNELKADGHRVLIYFQMTKMMDLMEEYLTYRQHKYVRLDGSSKLSERRDLVNDWQTKPELFVFLLSTRAGGLGINLTAADTVIFYDSDWNPTIDSQAMDRAHRLGQTKQVTVYRLLVRGTIEERMRHRAKQKEQVQQVVMEGGRAVSSGVDFQKGPGREVAYWLMDDDETVDAAIRQKEQEQQQPAKTKGAGAAGGGRTRQKKKEVSLEDMYHEGEGNFDESSSRPDTGASTPVPTMSDSGVPSRR